MSYTEQDHEVVIVGKWYVVAVNVDECLVATRVWFGMQTRYEALIEIDCLAVDRIES